MERWANDLKLSLEWEIKDLDHDIKEICHEGQVATALTDNLLIQKKLRAVENGWDKKRWELTMPQDAIDRLRDELIGKIKRQLSKQRAL